MLGPMSTSRSCHFSNIFLARFSVRWPPVLFCTYVCGIKEMMGDGEERKENAAADVVHRRLAGLMAEDPVGCWWRHARS